MSHLPNLYAGVYKWHQKRIGKKKRIPYANFSNHAFGKNVVPWIAWGNSSTSYRNKGSDKTSMKQRYNLAPPLPGSKSSKAINAIKKLKLYNTVR